jgi:SAM-dependent methyltransferase
VRDQYEESPYPRWLSVNIREGRAYPEPLLDVMPGVSLPEFGNDELHLLVAGCGTGKHAVQSATRFDACLVSALDLSLNSLAYGMRKCRELGVDNIRFFRGDILNLENIGRRFDIIESVGVLHHLREPEAGLRVLRSLLMPQGLMCLGLYSSRARRAVYAARKQFDADAGYPGPDRVRAARRNIMDLPEAAPVRGILNMQDFFSLSDCRDLLFHVQEHSYRLTEIRSMLERAALGFLGFELPDPQIRIEFQREYPGDHKLADLACWERFEQDHPDTFAGMYVFWCQALA